MSYDRNNVFAKILRGEIPATKLYEDEFAVAFPDISPAAPTHILVVPKGEYICFADFMTRANSAEVQGFFASIEKIAAQHKLKDYRLITNNGEGAGQTVHHFHVHILAGFDLHGLLPH
jgi:histidine triad (HIT) family protein